MNLRKLLYYSTLLSVLFLLSCDKKDDPKPDPEPEILDIQQPEGADTAFVDLVARLPGAGSARVSVRLNLDGRRSIRTPFCDDRQPTGAT